MEKQYDWRANLGYRSGETDWLSHGVEPSGQENWQSALSGTPQTKTYTYWFRDSNTSWQGHFQDALSSRLAISVTDSWTASVDNSNNLVITISTTINSIVRDDIRHPSGYTDQNTPGRNITIYRSEGGSQIWNTTDNQVATAHTLLGSPIVLSSETFTLAPGAPEVSRSSLYLHNQTVGMTSFDDIWLGIGFRNPLPPDYIPGKVFNGTAWVSHNRSGGARKLYTGSGWGADLKTENGGSGTGNPPSIYHSDGWKNMRKIGAK